MAMNPRRFAPLVAIVLLASACGGSPTPTEVGSGPSTTDVTIASTTTTTPATTTTIDPASPEARLAAARARWADSGPKSYTIETRQTCFCPPTTWVDTIVNGVVVSHESMAKDAFFDPGARTMEDQFNEIGAAITEGYASIDLRFDSETGALISWWVDVSEMMADEEHGVEVISFEPITDVVDQSPIGANADVTVSALASPICPVETDPPTLGCVPQPVIGATIIATDTQGNEVASGVTSGDGLVIISLPPGSYTLVPQPVEGFLGTAPTVEIVVTDAVPLQVQVNYDTGIR